MSGESPDRRAGSPWVSTFEGRHLSGRAKRDTAPERLLRSALHRLGMRFRLQVRIDSGCRPDIILPRHRIAVFVDGCFWHGCPEHGRKTPFTGPNAGLWDEKMVRNKERDRRASELAALHGYVPVRLWECQVRADPLAAAGHVALLSRAEQHGLCHE